MPRNNFQQDVEIRRLIMTIITASLFPNSRLVLCKIFSYDFPKISNLGKIFLRSFENVGPGVYLLMMFSIRTKTSTMGYNNGLTLISVRPACEKTATE